MRTFWLACLSLAFSASMGEAAQKSAPNIIFLLVDDLGSADVSWRGGAIETPNLDQLALGGASLERFYVQPVCSPTRSSLMTGRYPFRYGFQVGVVRPWADYGLPLEEKLLSQALKELGYETAIAGKWHLGHLSREYLPTSRGFDHQYGHYNGALDYFTHQRDGGHDWHRNDQPVYEEGYATELIGQEAVKRIRERDQSKPLFLYVPFNAPHTPLQVPESYTRPYAHLPKNRQIYAGMVACVDQQVGAMLKALEDEGIARETLILFASDNGGERPGRVSSNHPYRDGKFTLHEGGVRVSAFAYWPGVIEPNRQVEAPIHMVDWYPTLVKLAGGTLSQALPLDGEDVWPKIMANEAYSEPRTIPLNVAPQGGGLLHGHWKLLVTKRPAATAKLELYDLSKDPKETHDLAHQEPERVAALLKRYEAFEREAVPPKTQRGNEGYKPLKIWGHPEQGTLGGS